ARPNGDTSPRLERGGCGRVDVDLRRLRGGHALAVRGPARDDVDRRLIWIERQLRMDRTDRAARTRYGCALNDVRDAFRAIDVLPHQGMDKAGGDVEDQIRLAPRRRLPIGRDGEERSEPRQSENAEQYSS